ncbi:hypothetical protein [Reichenbachiella agariperforans]|uniref:hypothetical protein n=1 Tax=Reichenbachiella agariperforans TaxID=156994 RepID=UPI001C09CA4D|nr:hypothetical protein [Reichenbachiella agariperforans]MBU2912705.1 hypothetical protein [Reichenbachiella agariperforans]
MNQEEKDVFMLECYTQVKGIRYELDLLLKSIFKSLIDSCNEKLKARVQNDQLELDIERTFLKNDFGCFLSLGPFDKGKKEGGELRLFIEVDRDFTMESKIIEPAYHVIAANRRRFYYGGYYKELPLFEGRRLRFDDGELLTKIYKDEAIKNRLCDFLVAVFVEFIEENKKRMTAIKQPRGVKDVIYQSR